MASLFTTQQDNVIVTTMKLMELLKVKVTRSSIQKSLQEHPDYPSMLSVMDVLANWKVKAVGIELLPSQLLNIDPPFLAQIKQDRETEFVVVENIDSNNVTYYLNNKIKNEDLNDFSKMYKGKALLVDDLEGAGELQYRQRHLKELLKKIQLPFVVLLSILLMTLVVINALSVTDIGNIFTALFVFFSLCGAVVTGMLLWYEIDQGNPVLKKICTSGRNTNCGNVLQSKAAKLGGGISWSEIGFIYFAGGFLSLLLSGMDATIMGILAWFNALAAPYVFFSIFYQWKIVKKWCVLCLTIQALLIVELASTVMGHLFIFSVENVTLSIFITILFSFLVPGILWSFIRPLWIKAEEGRRNKAVVQRLKYTSSVFEGLLVKQKKIDLEGIEEMGITLGNPNGKHKLVKVCNPFCGPCSMAHPVLDELLDNYNNLHIRIIFVAYDNEHDKAAAPTRHFLAIDEKENKDIVKQALDDWYLAKRKNYEKFASKYPMNETLKKQGKKIQKMRKWCDDVEISFTPTIFIDGYQLPDLYSVHDLKHFLSD
ncbi:MAG TPA: vitamin K epoxide reductase family protein [Chitinophagaceae bacterium]|nr:vitamin K epoxide reductase family protein [Chitinophagaceae bacterium]